MFFLQNDNILGLDIGSSSIKVAEVRLKNKKLKLMALGQIFTPQQTIFGGEILNSDKIGETIKTLIKKLKLRTKNVASSLWGTSVIVKKVSIPKTDVKLIDEQIKWVAEQYVPYDFNEINLDYKVLKSHSSDSMNVLLVAATQKVIFGFVECISSAGLNCKVLDVEGCALANCFDLNYRSVFSNQPNSEDSNKDGSKANIFSVGILDIGANTTNFVVLENKEIIFCRDIPIGGVTYINELQKNLGVNIHEAESLKLNVVSGKEVPEEASSVIQSSHEIVIGEIKSNVDFFLNTSGDHIINDFYITGGCIKIPGLFSALEQNFNCKKLDPFRSMEIDQRQFSSEYIEKMSDFSAVSIGLSLRN